MIAFNHHALARRNMKRTSYAKHLPTPRSQIFRLTPVHRESLLTVGDLQKTCAMDGSRPSNSPPELLVRSPPKNEGVLRTDTLQRSTKRGLLSRLPAISWPVKNREGQSRSECRHDTSHKSEGWTAIRTGGGEPPRLLQIGVGKGMARLIGPVAFATARVASVTVSSVESLLIMGGCVVNAFFTHFYLPASGQAVVTCVVPSFPRFLPSDFIAHKV